MQALSRYIEDATVVIRALRHPDATWQTRMMVLGTIAYVLSPIDVLPEAIPLLGMLDDVAIIPLGINLALKMLPETVEEEIRADVPDGRQVTRKLMIIVAVLGASWVLMAVFLAVLLIRQIT